MMSWHPGNNGGHRETRGGADDSRRTLALTEQGHSLACIDLSAGERADGADPVGEARVHEVTVVPP
jgi:hypothetical protein